MKNKVVIVPAILKPITESPGFAKKLLSEYKLDLVGLCGFGCRYCSSNWGNYLRINRERLADEVERQLGVRIYPDRDPSLTIEWGDIFEKLERQLQGKSRTWGQGKTLVFSMLTDGFSPLLVEGGQTRRALELILSRTSFRIRVLTKSAVVGSPEWIQFFAKHRDRFVVGLATGTLDDRAARGIELGTAWPSRRLAALRELQDAGIATYGMLCPVLPDVLEDDGDGLRQLIAAVRPAHVEHIWAEPYNDRRNWEVVHRGYQPGSFAHTWFEQVFAKKNWSLWSRYATELYRVLHDEATRGGWSSKLRYLLYELRITSEDARLFERTNLEGVLLQSRADQAGFSRNRHFRASHETSGATYSK